MYSSPSQGSLSSEKTSVPAIGWGAVGPLLPQETSTASKARPKKDLISLFITHSRYLFLSSIRGCHSNFIKVLVKHYVGFSFKLDG
jgi:hypothetical protein